MYFLFCGSTVHLKVVEGGVCTAVVGRCDARDCDEHCKSFLGGKKKYYGWTCLIEELCTCFFEPGPPPGQPSCRVVLGLCSDQCDPNCCNSKCANAKRGTGNCIDAFDKELCMCSYNGWVTPWMK